MTRQRPGDTLYDTISGRVRAAGPTVSGAL